MPREVNIQGLIGLVVSSVEIENAPIECDPEKITIIAQSILSDMTNPDNAVTCTLYPVSQAPRSYQSPDQVLMNADLLSTQKELVKQIERNSTLREVADKLEAKIEELEQDLSRRKSSNRSKIKRELEEKVWELEARLEKYEPKPLPCPACGSKDITTSKGIDGHSRAMALCCNTCGLRGPVKINPLGVGVATNILIRSWNDLPR